MIIPGGTASQRWAAFPKSGGTVSALQLFPLDLKLHPGVTSGWSALNALFLRDVGNCDGHSGLGDAVSKSKGF